MPIQVSCQDIKIVIFRGLSQPLQGNERTLPWNKLRPFPSESSQFQIIILLSQNRQKTREPTKHSFLNTVFRHYMIVLPQKFPSPVAYARGLDTIWGGKEENDCPKRGAPMRWHTKFRATEAKAGNSLIPVLTLAKWLEQRSRITPRLRARRPGFHSE